jgi:hypothetical protein
MYCSNETVNVKLLHLKMFFKNFYVSAKTVKTEEQHCFMTCFILSLYRFETHNNDVLNKSITSFLSFFGTKLS